MIGKRGNFLVMAPGTFQQLEIKHHFPFDLLKKKIIGYISLGMIWILYEEKESIIRTPFARNRKWFKAITSDPEFAVLARLPQIYVV